MQQFNPPMNATPAPPLIQPRSTHLRFLIVFAVLLLVPALLVVGVVAGVTSYFRPSSDTKALRNGLVKASGVEWRQQIALNVGGLTFGAVRGGLSFPARREPRGVGSRSRRRGRHLRFVI